LARSAKNTQQNTTSPNLPEQLLINQAWVNHRA
jgi:hypothetical protein